MTDNKVYDVKFVSTIRELVETSVRDYPERLAFMWREGGEKEFSVTYEQLLGEIKALSTALNSMGYQGKRVAVTGKNSYLWMLSYLAVTCGTGVVVPIDKDLKADDVAGIIGMSETDLLIYSAEKQSMVDELCVHCEKICMSEIAALISKGKELLDGGDTSYADHFINPKALGALLYTSGTTGVAKGVMLSQYNICWDIAGVLKRFRLTHEDRSLALLPLHHTYECTCELAFLYSGACIAYSEGLRHMLKEFKAYSPTVLIAVPLLLEKFHSNILKKLAEVKGGMVMFNAGKMVLSVSDKLKDILAPKLFAKIHDTFGGKLKIILCGAASLDPKIFEDYEKMGFRIYNGYGLTETAPICVMHDDNVRNSRTVGYPVCGMKAKLDNVNEEGVGELCVMGENVMLGYYNDPEETAKVLKDGWFHTGDLAKQQPDGQYSIVGRTKSMIVTKNGKKVFPEEIETLVKKSKFISECLVVGEEDEAGNVVVAIRIFPNFEELDKKLAEDGITKPAAGVGDSGEYDEAVKKAMKDIVLGVNEKMPAYKAVHKISVRYTEFEKTTTQKIKRNAKENIEE